MRPIIGLISDIDDDFSAQVYGSYPHAIEMVGGTPLLLPYIKNEETINHFIDICDGFLFTGGDDIEPCRYGEEKKETCGEIQVNRDELEFKVFKKVLESSKPILAICRGIQVVNVAFGGTLYQDIPTEYQTSILHRQSEPRTQPSHKVKVLENTPLSKLMGAERVNANSFHHQAVKVLGKGLKLMGVAEDGMVEAVYLPGERYLRAYQWHPERLVDTDEHNRSIFEDFIGACKAFRLQN